MSSLKTCQKCGVSKHAEMFHRNALMQDGFAARCKECEKARKAAYRASNNDKERESNAAYKSKNAEKIKAQQAKWRSENAEKERARNVAYYAANKDKRREAAAIYRAENPDKFRTYARNRRALKRESGGKLSPGLEAKLFKLQRGKCACGCGQFLGGDYHLDHIMPLSLGGTNTDDNIQLLRSRCNQVKYAKHPIEFMQSRGFLL